MNKSSIRQVISGITIVALIIAIYFFGMYLIGTFIKNAIAATIVDIVFKILIGTVTIIVTKFIIKVIIKVIV